MHLDLPRLVDLHPRLDAELAAHHAFRAALAFRTAGHEPGVVLIATLGAIDVEARVVFEPRSGQAALQTDLKRNTEDGAEAIALALVGTRCRWRVRRRLQQKEKADWLLEGPGREGGRRYLVALEVSGVAGRDRTGARLREKIGQVRECPIEGLAEKVACVVEFGPPRLRLAAAE